MYVENLEELITFQSKEFLDTPLGEAFQILNNKGIRTYKDCGITIDDGLLIITERGSYEGPFAYFDEWQHFRFLEENKCMLWFGALEEGYDLSDLQNIIKEVLASKGIKCSYEEEYGDGILIETAYKYKNSFPLSDLIWAAFKYKFAENQATECMIREVTCLLNQDTDEQSVNYYDLDNDDDIEDLDTVFQTFMYTKDKLIELRNNTMLQDEEMYEDDFSEDNISSEFSYRSLQEIVDNVDWEAVWQSIHYFCDESVIKNRISRISGKNVEEIDLNELKSRMEDNGFI